MFNQDTCKRCGLCLIECPFIELSKKEARAEIKNMLETKESGTIVKNCAGCAYCDMICPTHSNPSHLKVEKAEEKNIDVYYITELAQMAIGERPLHRLKEMKNQLTKNIIKKVGENPGILKQKYIIKNGQVIPV